MFTGKPILPQTIWRVGDTLYLEDLTTLI
ncbi:hypothetical protein LINPERPRIM_LOCUS15337 [Linum perenne]